MPFLQFAIIHGRVPLQHTIEFGSIRKCAFLPYLFPGAKPNRLQ